MLQNVTKCDAIRDFRFDLPHDWWARQPAGRTMPRMKQRYHTIIKPDVNGSFVGWVEEVPGALTHGRSLDECRDRLRSALRLMLETHRDEARQGLDDSCIQEAIEIDLPELQPQPEQFAAHYA